MFNKKDLMLLDLIRDNSRKSMPEMSRGVRLPLKFAFRRFRYLQKTVIKKFVCLINFDAIGYPHRIGLWIKCGNRAGAENFFLKHPMVNSLFHINKDYDFLVEAFFRDLRELEEFINELEAFEPKNVGMYHLVEELKKEGFLMTKNAKTGKAK